MPHPNDHWPIIALGHDPDRCVLQNFVGKAPVEHAAPPAAADLRAQAVRQMASQQLEDDHLRHDERIIDACGLPAAVTIDSEWSRTSGSTCEGGECAAAAPEPACGGAAAVPAPVQPVLRQRSVSNRRARSSTPWFYARRYGTGALRKPRWRTKTAAPMHKATLVLPTTVPPSTTLRHSPRLASPCARQSGMLVLAGVELPYRHLPTDSPTPGTSHALVRHVSPLRLRHQAEHVPADSLPSDPVVLWRPGQTDTVTPPAMPRDSDSANR